MSKTKAQLAKEKEEAQEALEWLRELLGPLDTIYTMVTWVSRDGMSRAIVPFIAVPGKDGRPEIINISWLVAKIGVGRFSHNHGGVVVNGAGMDMAFHLVYSISRAVFQGQAWECQGEKCGSNTHVNSPRVQRGPGVMHDDADAGYRLHKASIV